MEGEVVMFLVGLMVGFFVGGIGGVLTFALCTAAKNEDLMEK